MQQQLPPKHEYQIESDFDVQFILHQGTCTIFGKPVERETYITLQRNNIHIIYTHFGCTFEINQQIGFDQNVGVDLTQNNDIPQQIFLNVSQYFSEKSLISNNSIEQYILGPVIAISGGKYSNKQFISEIFANYQVQNGWNPIYIDLDPFTCKQFLPGCIGAIHLTSFMDSEDKIQLFTGQNELNTSNLDNYLKQIEILAGLVKKKIVNDKNKCILKFKNAIDNQQTNSAVKILKVHQKKHLFSSGVIINIPYFPFEYRKIYEIHQKIIKLFEVSIIVIVEEDQLYGQLNKEFYPKVEVLKLNSIGTKEYDDIKEVNRYQFNKNYSYNIFFSGLDGMKLQSTAFMNFDDVVIYQINHGFKKIEFDQESIVTKVVGIVNIDKDEENIEEKLINGTLIQIIQVQNINLSQKTFEFLIQGQNIDETIKAKAWVIGDISFNKQ